MHHLARQARGRVRLSEQIIIPSLRVRRRLLKGRVITYGLPTLFQFPTKFLARLQAQVQSGNAKILTDPTVVVQEGERSEVRLTQDVVTNIITQTTFGTGSSQSNTTVETEEAGLALDLFLDRIDDNGFITINVSPSISTPVGSQVIESGLSRNTITLLSRRSVKSGLIRMRDGQTLMLAGIIAESDRTTVRKVPILGDIPLLGALFRSTNRDKQRNEVIVMLTPRILSDNDRSTFGYGYTPGADVQQMLQQRSIVEPVSHPFEPGWRGLIPSLFSWKWDGAPASITIAFTMFNSRPKSESDLWQIS